MAHLPLLAVHGMLAQEPADAASGCVLEPFAASACSWPCAVDGQVSGACGMNQAQIVVAAAAEQ